MAFVFSGFLYSLSVGHSLVIDAYYFLLLLILGGIDKKTDIDKLVKIQNPEINSYIDGQLIFENVTKAMQGERIVLPRNCVRITRYQYLKNESKPLPYTQKQKTNDSKKHTTKKTSK